MNKLYLLFALGASVSAQTDAGDCFDIAAYGYTDLLCQDYCFENFYYSYYNGFGYGSSTGGYCGGFNDDMAMMTCENLAVQCPAD